MMKSTCQLNQKTQQPIRYFRVIFVALIWIIFQSAIAGYVHGNSLGQLVANYMPLGGVFFLIILVFLVNPVLKNVVKVGFSVSELALIFIMIAAASCVPEYGMMEFLHPYLAAPLYFANPENQWMETLIPNLPDWAYLSDKRAVQDFFTGFSGEYIPWKAWASPAIFWIAFSLTFFFALACWAVILRRQWVEHERYVFPLVQIPAQIVQPDSFLKNRLLWIGIAVAFTAHLFKGLHMYFPAIPSFRLSYSLAPLFTEKP